MRNKQHNKETKMTKTQEQLRQEGLRAARNMVRKFKAREKASYYPQTIADKMEKGLTKEIEMYAAISKALREDGNSKSQVSYYMSVDEDFIPDVLQAYA